jgi:cobalt-zinc-cadmium efflux system outer membrane protein
LAVEHSPLLRQAAAQVETARGKAIQAGAPPNPTLGYEGDTVRQADTPGMQGGYATQTFITAGKLTIAAQAAHVEFHNAMLALRRARIELATNVRRGFADVLVARERVRFALALADLADDIYRAQIDRVAVGESAPYEPLQLRVLAVQARNEAVRAVNAETAAWRSLASAVGMPDWSPVPLAGAADRTFPAVSSAAAAAWLEARHTDLAIARNGIAKSRRLLDLARVTPIPDVEVYTAIQKDNTTPPYNVTYNLQVGLPIPLFNRNRGNIVAAEADVVHAVQEPDRVRNTLLAQLAAALAEYDSARELAARYRGDVLRNQVQTYRGVHARFHVDREKSDFSELVISQQTLATALREYVDVLREQWDAAIRLAALLQVDDLSELEHLTDGPASPSGPAPVPAPAPESE